MDVLTRKRARIKGNFTRIENFLKGLSAEYDINVHELTIRDALLEKYFEEYNLIQDSIEDSIDTSDDQFHMQVSDRELIENRYISLKTKIKELIAIQNSKDSDSIASSKPSSPVLQSKHSSPVRINLPSMNIPTFNGNYGEWRTFYDLYMAAIHSDTRLSNAQKFVYLKSFLKEEPLFLISKLSITDENYLKAFQILKERYDKKLHVINYHINGLIHTNIGKGSQGLRNFSCQVRQHINALEAVNVEVFNNWDLILVHIFANKLDRYLRNEFEMGRNQDELPTLKEFFCFLDKKVSVWEISEQNYDRYRGLDQRQPYRNNSNFMTSHASLEGESNNFLDNSNENLTNQHLYTDITCAYCKGVNHNISRCHKFESLSINEKRNVVARNRLCFNCLNQGHMVSSCRRERCTTCSGRHHTLLHENRNNLTNKNTNSKEENVSQNKCLVSDEQQVSTCTITGKLDPISEAQCLASLNKHTVLLSTAKVKLFSDQGDRYELFRVLLDSASQSSFVTSELVNKLNAKTEDIDLQISGVSQCKTKISKWVNLKLQSIYSNRETFSVNCGIMERITCSLPQHVIDISKFNLPNHINLADIEFNIPGKIDMLIGADLYFELIEPGLIDLGLNLPKLINTKLGWILGGSWKLDKIHPTSNLSVVLFSKDEINDLIPKFWQLEEVSAKRVLSSEDKMCERIFTTTTVRNNEGRFIVNLPLKKDINNMNLGESFEIAKRRFFSLERKLLKNERLYEQYREFINEYINLGHAKYVPFELEDRLHKFKNFIPHHGVMREDSLTTKLRVVFDNSMKTTSGVSLNDQMFKGPIVQSDLFDIICRFRNFKYVLMTDIEKMYRQIWVNPEHRHLQNILWRDNSYEELKCVELQTVSYGTNCAPFLATRCLIQLAEEGANSHPLASEALYEQCYVDDILAGSNSVEGLERVRNELKDLLGQGGFRLHKWASNIPGFIENLELSPSDPTNIKIHVDECLRKVLGIKWEPFSDNLIVCDFSLSESFALTKRNILSRIARLFDPLGFIGPVVLIAKFLMQKIWTNKTEWDETVSQDLCNEWLNFSKNIPNLAEIKIPRLLFEHDMEVKSFEVHGFSDASQKAYGTCFYLRTIYVNNKVTCKLICSKSRVAPLKTQTLPRLELCSAVLMARLCHKLCSVFKFEISKVVLWSDSKIVLCWINSDSNRWTTFVANRVSEIQELTMSAIWRHVTTDKNPADHISRGLTSSALIVCDKWWNGPQFLYDPNLNFKFTKESTDIGNGGVPEQRETYGTHLAVNSFSSALQLFSNFSKFRRLQRSLAYCFRFVRNCLRPKTKLIGPLSVDELTYSQQVIIKCLQGFHFELELRELHSHHEIRSGPLAQLAPFIDEYGIIRMNSRLAHSDLPMSQKYPMIISSKDYVASLIFKQEHLDLHHAGPQTVLANLRLRFWPISGLRQIKRVIKECLICHRFKAAAAQQVMAPLPKDRTSIARPFLKVGIDYGGPLWVKESRLRKTNTYKAYIALFICMVTKAVHLELVSSLSTDAFISSLKRFISRRGCPEIIYSDNGTNFRGAHNVLRELDGFLKRNETAISDFLSLREIKWKFIPPSSPHWGGLWEAGIKSTKFHLKRVMGNSTLTFEQLTTVLCQIEAILNSRPLSALSTDSCDFSCLTPSHFLIGEVLTAFPEKDLSNVTENRLKFWEHCQKVRQLFWKRWSVEFLTRLQNRPKWTKSFNNLKVGDLVLLREDNLPPLEWRLARIIETFPGKDYHIRVVKIRTKNGEFMRPITKLCPLPFTFSSTEGEDVGTLAQSD